MIVWGKRKRRGNKRKDGVYFFFKEEDENGDVCGTEGPEEVKRGKNPIQKGARGGG